jgi:hypothetical protein
VGYSLSDFIHEYGAPEHLTFDGDAVQVGSGTRFKDNLRRAEIKHHVSTPRRPNENPAEGSIREVKKRWYRMMTKKNVPKRLWDYGISWVCETGNVIANSSRYADQRTPLEIITGETLDITEYLDFTIYDWVIHKTNAGVAPPELGRWLGVSHRVGQLMSYWILPPSGIPISCTTVQRLTQVEQQTDEWRQRMNKFTENLKDKFQTSSADVTSSTTDVPTNRILVLEHKDKEFLEDFNQFIDDGALKHADDDDDQEVGELDPYLNMELGLPRGQDNELQHAQVKRGAVDVEGKPVGRPSTNPLLDSRQYKVEFMDGETEILTANIIAENLLAQVDEEGHRQMLINEIEDHRINVKKPYQSNKEHSPPLLE